jgi:hypothetical protein
MTETTDDTIVQKSDNTQTIKYTQIKALLANVSDNPAKLEFPTDKWGFTSGIKKEVLKAASTVRGQQDKHDLLTATIAVLLQHIKVRLDKDRIAQEQRLAEIDAARDERAPRERVTATVTASNKEEGEP